MFDRYFDSSYAWIKRARWFIVGLLVLLTAGAVVGLRFISFDNNVEQMLPANQEIPGLPRTLFLPSWCRQQKGLE